MKLTAVFEPAKEGGYTCFVEEIPAAISQGETIEEAKANLADALKLALQCQRELARFSSSVFFAHHRWVGDVETALRRTKLVDQPAVLRAIGEESTRKGSASLSSRQIDRIIQAARKGKKPPLSN